LLEIVQQTHDLSPVTRLIVLIEALLDLYRQNE
jgi:hypothetical protein